jgi:hypothetical protein
MNKLEELVREDRETLWYESVVYWTVYVKKQKKALYMKGKVIPGTERKKFSCWSGGCGIGQTDTLEEAIKLCNRYLEIRTKELEEKAIKELCSCSTYLTLRKEQPHARTGFYRQGRSNLFLSDYEKGVHIPQQGL